LFYHSLGKIGNVKNKAPGFTKALVTVFLGDGAGRLLRNVGSNELQDHTFSINKSTP